MVARVIWWLLVLVVAGGATAGVVLGPNFNSEGPTKGAMTVAPRPAVIAAPPPVKLAPGEEKWQMEYAQDCLWQITYGKAPEVRCSFPTVMSEAELAKLRGMTRNYLQNFACNVSVRIDRELLDRAMSEPDHHFKAPPQKVRCNADTSRGKLPISFTFSPEVRFRGGVAISASPGMSAMKGVSLVLGWPIKSWINSSDTIEANMVKGVNDYLEWRRKVK